MIKIQPFLNQKMILVGFERQWYITQHAVFTTRLQGLTVKA